jgi:hypothetical protein
MPIIQVVIIIIVVGVLLWLIETYFPLDATYKRILQAVVIIVLVLWLLGLFFDLGSLGSVGTHKIGR